MTNITSLMTDTYRMTTDIFMPKKIQALTPHFSKRSQEKLTFTLIHPAKAISRDHI